MLTVFIEREWQFDFYGFDSNTFGTLNEIATAKTCSNCGAVLK
jgi:hypothetical protein